MKKYILSLFALALSFSQVFAQTEKRELTPEESRALMKDIGLDSARMLKEATNRACSCIDSVLKVTKEKNKQVEAFAACIDEEVISYQLSLKLLAAMNGAKKDNTISLQQDKNSNEYKRYYYEIERKLNDSCAVMRQALFSNDERGEKSISDDPEARKAYTAGVEQLNQENYAAAIPYFEKAVKIDPQFAFAWDNLGICYRRTGKLDEAIKAYQASLKVDPKGHTPLQNLPVVYKLQNKADEAIAAYQDILKYYPDDPEVYYGISLVYFDVKNDMENSLRNMCKAYNLYIAQKSPYRTDAEKTINSIYQQMKKDGKEEQFFQILKDNNISVNK